MATYLFDSNAVSDAMADHPQLRARCAAQAGLLQTSAIVVGEIRYGLARLPAGKRRDALTAKADLVLAALLIEPVTEATALVYADIRAATIARGFNLDDNDLWIAATALSTGAVLISRDIDFAQVPGLVVEDWTQ